MNVTNFGDSLVAGRPPMTAQQIADNKVHALAYLERHNATDLADMLGVTS